MSETLEELLIKVGVEVDDKELENTRKDLKNLQEEGKKAAEAIRGVSSSKSSSSSSNNNNDSKLINDNSEIVDILTKSQKNLFELLEVVKKNQKGTGPTQGSNQQGSSKGALGLVNNVVEANTGTLVGGAAGAGIGALFGGAGAIAGAQIGSQIGALTEKIFNKVSEKLGLIAEQFDNRLEQDNHLRQLSYQTGKSVESLYKLQQQALLAGISLENVVGSAQDLSDEMFGGMSEEKAKVYMALGINPRNLIEQAKGDPEKAQQLIYQQATNTLQNSPAAYRTTILKKLGISEIDQDARRRLYTKDFSDRAQDITNKATKDGKVPFRTNEELNKDNLEFRGALLDISASLRAALTVDGIAKTLSTKLIEVKADTINMVTSAVINLSGKINSSSTATEKVKPVLETPIDKNGVKYNPFTLMPLSENPREKSFGNNTSQNAKAVGQ